MLKRTLNARLGESANARLKEQPEWIIVYSVWPADKETHVPKQQDRIHVAYLGRCSEIVAQAKAEKFKYDWEHRPHNLGTGAYKDKILQTLDYCVVAEAKKQLGVDTTIELGVYVGE